MNATIQTKKLLIAGVVGALALTYPLYAGALSQKITPISAYASEQAVQKGVITVSGQGEMLITPDVAYINIGILTQGNTANEAQTANAEAFEKLRKVLHGDYSIEAKDVKTSGFSVYPEYSYTDRNPVIKGYNASQTLTVTYRNLDGIGPLLDAASAAGANQMNGIQFGTEKGLEYELQVIEKALDNAKSKAETIAKYAGKELQGIVSVSQGAVSPVPVARASYAPEMASMDMAKSAPTAISAGELKVTTTVTVQYEF